LVTAWRKGNQLRDPSALGAWLLRIAARHALTRRRRIGATLPLLPEQAERLAAFRGVTFDGFVEA